SRLTGLPSRALCPRRPGSDSGGLDPSRPLSARSRLARQVLIGTLLAVYALAAATSIRQKSITFDELAHLTVVFSSWTPRDYRLFPQNGQFPQRWAALPLVVFGFRFPTLD